MSTYRIGIDAGGTKVAYGLFDQENRLLDRFQQPTPIEADGPAFCAMVIDSIHAILEKTASPCPTWRELACACPPLSSLSRGMCA